MQDMKKLDKFLTVDEARSLAAVARYSGEVNG